MSIQQSEERRSGAQPLAHIVMFSTPWCGDCRRAKRVFAALDVPYTEIDIEHDPRAAQLVMQLNDGNRSVPTILFPDGAVLVEPSTAELEAKLNMARAS
ncbi:MAG TPA: glutaredoxin domain-containing protein [Ktedonobacterales bacterium]|jgi:mycoredoxin|nr:glutaredoxin domain-containing protein [Ktedonobacterales bacterium]